MLILPDCSKWLIMVGSEVIYLNYQFLSVLKLRWLGGYICINSLPTRVVESSCLPTFKMLFELELGSKLYETFSYSLDFRFQLV